MIDIITWLNTQGTEWQYVGVGRDDGRKAGEYSPIFYRPGVWDLLDHKTVWLSKTPDVPSKSWDAASTRILTVGIFQHRQTKKEVITMNTHLDDQGRKSRLEAAKIIVSQIASLSHRDGRADVPTFLAGDFNSETHMEAYRYLTEFSPMTDVYTTVPKDYRYGHEDTFTGFGYEVLPLTRIDFIFINSTTEAYDQNTADRWVVKSYGVLENRFDDGIFNSDHRAVVADLLLS